MRSRLLLGLCSFVWTMRGVGFLLLLFCSWFVLLFFEFGLYCAGFLFFPFDSCMFGHIVGLFFCAFFFSFSFLFHFPEFFVVAALELLQFFDFMHAVV